MILRGHGRTWTQEEPNRHPSWSPRPDLAPMEFTIVPGEQQGPVRCKFSQRPDELESRERLLLLRELLRRHDSTAKNENEAARDQYCKTYYFTVLS